MKERHAATMRWRKPMSQDGAVIMSIFRGTPRARPIEITMLERHPLGSQAFYPLSPDPWLIVVASGADGSRATAKLHRARRHAAKRGGGWEQVELADVSSEGGAAALDLVGLDDALSELGRHDDTKAIIVELRFFAGMSVADVAQVLGRSETFVRTEWYVARAWLKSRLT